MSIFREGYEGRAKGRPGATGERELSQGKLDLMSISNHFFLDVHVV